MKNTLRKKIAAARDGLSPEQRENFSREIEKKLFLLPEFREASAVLFFASFRSEISTLPMIRHALEAGKRVILPKVKGNELALFEITDFDSDTAAGAWGIPEPLEANPVTIGDVDLLIVPGLAFDESGNRLGYGAGFYDRMLPSYKKKTVALAFELQMVPKIPVSPHDIPIQKIVTEKRIVAIH